MPKKVAAVPKNNKNSKKIVLAADPMGAGLKNAVKKHLESEGYEIIDYGTDCAENFVTYFGISAKAAKAIQQGLADKGIVFCGTGVGVGITANKFKGIYCGIVDSEFAAEQCKVINNCNMLAMGGWLMSETKAILAVDNWLNKKFNEGTPEQFVKIVEDGVAGIAKIEDNNFK
jgi:ribose 5-phosphate isomerase B